MTQTRLYATTTGLLLLLVGLSSGISGQAPASRPVTDALFRPLQMRGIGPAVFAGRINDIAVYEKNPAQFYVGATNGGLWKTVNNGTTWEVLFTEVDDASGIGAVAISQSNPDLVWLGTGGTQSWGRGVFKSTDGGASWQAMGLSDTKQISRIIVDPADANIVWVASPGHLYGPNRERGVFKTLDGGRTWQHVLFVDDDTGAFDLVMDPGDPQVLYATTYQRRRAPWGTNGGGPGSGIRKTVDGGRTWTRLERGLPEGDLGIIGIDIHRANPRVLYAMLEHAGGKDLFRTEDGGESWRKTNEPEDARYLGHSMRWFDQVRVDPVNDQRVYVMGVNVYTSEDGGRTFAINESAVQSGLWPATSGLWIYNTSAHSDQRTFWINPANPQHLITGNDGGVCISYEAGATWDCMNNMDLGQFHHVGFDMDVPYRVYGGLYDNLGWGGPSATRSYLGIGAGEWFLVAGGDGFVAVADPNDSRTIYAESQNGNVSRVDRLTNERQPIKPQPAEGEEPYRWNFNTPFMMSPHRSSTLLMAGNHLFRSLDRGQSWTAISPDLTAGITAEGLSLMGVPMGQFTLGSRALNYGTIFTLTESPVRPGIFYTGADDGTVQVSRDDGKTWTNVSDRFPGLPPRTWVSKIEASRFDEGTVYATFAGFRADDYRTYVYTSRDYGSTWRAITNGIPDGHYVAQTILEDQRNPDVLYLGTEFGLFLSIDRGSSWHRLRNNLPTVPIHGLAQHPRENDLLVATFGRGIWILDDVTPIQQAADALGAEAYLFDMRPALQFNQAHDKWWMWGDRRFWGENPPAGAVISYYLGKPAHDVRLTIRDSGGNVVRQIGSDEMPGTDAGIRRIVWNLRHQPLPEPAALRRPDGVAAFFSGNQKRAHSYRQIDRQELNSLYGPFVLPGLYRVTLTVDGRDVEVRGLTVNPDPLIPISEGERRAWRDATLDVHDLQRVAHAASDRTTVLAAHFSVLETAVKKRAGLPASVGEEVAAMARRLGDLRLRLDMPRPGAPGGNAARGITNLPGQLGSLKTQLLGATSLPTTMQQQTVASARRDLAAAVEEINGIASADLERLHTLLGRHRVVIPQLEPMAALTGPRGGGLGRRHARSDRPCGRSFYP
ncbi:MAG: hypothetical protein H0X67_08545 [Acidobacteria bacterium]|nr:hypothetical protein [Acidobacteriota bacterium]